LLVSKAHASDAALRAALEPLIGAIDLGTMQHANLMVDRTVDKRTPEEAARILDSGIQTIRR
jgi:osmoprotectant transport system permease protein